MVTASRPDARPASVPAEARRAGPAPRGTADFAPRDILGNIGWLLAAQAVAGGGQFGLSVLLARHLGAETYGQWTFAFAFVALCAVLADFGFSTLAVRDLARDPTAAPRYLGNVLAIKVAISIALLGAMAAVVPLINRDRVVLALVLLLGGQMVLTSFSQLLFSTFRAQGRTQFEAAARGLQALLLLVLAFVLVSRGAGVQAFGWAALATAGGGLLFTGALVVRWFARPVVRVDLSFCRSLLREAWPLALAMAMGAVYYYTDSLIMGVLGQDREVGWYGAAYVPVLGLAMIATAVRTAFLPAQTRVFAHGGRDGEGFLAFYGLLTARISFPLALAGPIVAGDAIEMLYGAEYRPATLALQLLCVTASVFFFSSYFGSHLIVQGRQNVYLLMVTLGAGLNVALNLALIPAYSLNGAAVATLASEALVCGGMAWMNRHLLSLRTIAGFAWRPFLAAAAAALTLVLVDAATARTVAAAAAALCYLGTSWRLAVGRGDTRPRLRPA